MAKVNKGNNKQGAVSSEVISFIRENRNDLSTSVGYGGRDVTIEDGVLCGGHFKLRSAMKQAGLSIAEQDEALA